MVRKQLPLPTLSEIKFSLIAIFFLVFSILNFTHISDEWVKLGLYRHFSEFEFYCIWIVQPIIFEYFLIWGAIISAILIFKIKIKKLPEEGLINGMFLGLWIALIINLIIFVLFGLIIVVVGLFADKDLASGTFVGIWILGSIIGLVIGLAAGIGFGFYGEFKK